MGKQKKARLQPGEVVGGRYRIDGVVGKGGFGAVYCAKQLDTGMLVALKVLLKNFSSSKIDSKRFQREASLVQKLKHPNVVDLLDFGVTEQGQSFIAFELLEGVALARVLKEQGAMPLYKAARIARDVLLALAAAHDLGIIHRDIKPGNVFLCAGDGPAKVLDFGIAKAVTGEDAAATQLTEAGQMIGTPHYMAPEQVRGTGIFKATDVYALGLLFAEMITGERVVSGNALIDIYMQHISAQPHVLHATIALSPVANVVERAVAKVAEQRYQTAGDMLDDLYEAMPGLKTSSPAASHTAQLSELEHFGAATTDFVRQPRPEIDEPMPHSSTVLMSIPDFDAQNRLESALVASGSLPPSVSPRSSAPPESAAFERDDEHALDTTVDMTSAQMDAMALGTTSPSWSPRSSGIPSGVPTSGAPASGVHATPYPSYDSGLVSGEHAYPSGAHRVEPLPAAAPPPRKKGGSGVALLLIAVAIVATVAAGLLIWAPWRDSSRTPAGRARLVLSVSPTWRSAPPHA